MKKYSSKLLLFGEHTVINWSKALALPFLRYFGSWQFGPKADLRLQGFTAYLQALESEGSFLNIPDFRKDVALGLHFESNIPVGYGLGSSGALCAAVYDRYAKEPISPEQIRLFPQLREQLAQMESYFHGSSSGTDPLICYLQQAVIIDQNKDINEVALPDLKDLPFSFFLLNTHMPRETGPLVRLYLNKCEQADYANRISRDFAPLVERVIDDFLQSRWSAVAQGVEGISRLQLELFSEMIPAGFQAIWEKGLRSGRYALKLCGAGGGGFLLGIAKDEDIINELNEQFPCESIW